MTNKEKYYRDIIRIDLDNHGIKYAASIAECIPAGLGVKAAELALKGHFNISIVNGMPSSCMGSICPCDLSHVVAKCAGAASEWGEKEYKEEG